MCGIIALFLKNNTKFFNIILESLIQIQNRGYDSAGFSYLLNNKINTIKYASTLNYSALEKLKTEFNCNIKSNNIIAHTRWATHGSKTDSNSHPHLSWDNKLSLVHNGIIENYQDIKIFLEKEGIKFKSQTDSEVISNLIEFYYLKSKDLESSIRQCIKQLQGTWGLAIIHSDYPNKMFCIRHGSPLLVGQDDNFIMVTSELSGFANKVKNYFILENNDLAIISNENNNIFINTNNIYKNKNININLLEFDLSPDPYPHWTIKEIMEQPQSIMRAISFGGRILNETNVCLGGLEEKKDILKRINNIIILGCGTSLHAGLIGAEYFNDLCNFNTVQVFDGAEFSYKNIPKIGNTALIYLSQSGETKDLHRCIEIGKEYDLFQIGVINVVDSLIAREVDCGCYLNAGREVGVASTKCFTNQIIVLCMMSIWFAQLSKINENKRTSYIKDLRQISQDFKKVLELCHETKNKELLTNFINVESLFLLGKGKSKFIASEGALKIKEICYIHAEGYGGSSLKHGPFALLDESHPVILLAPDNNFFSKMMNAKEEIISRNSPVLIITNKDIQYNNYIKLPSNKTFQDLLGIIPLQIAAYYCSIKKNINCDQPRNLAKCVNVE